jgi:hypothetical protein
MSSGCAALVLPRDRTQAETGVQYHGAIQSDLGHGLSGDEQLPGISRRPPAA